MTGLSWGIFLLCLVIPEVTHVAALDCKLVSVRKVYPGFTYRSEASCNGWNSWVLSGLFLSKWFLIHQSTQSFFTQGLCLKRVKEEAARILSTFVQNWHSVTCAALCGQKVKVQPRSKMEGSKLCLLM